MLGFFCFDPFTLPLHLVNCVGIELIDFSVHNIDVFSKLLSIVFKLFQAYLESGTLVVSLENLLLSLSNANLAYFILLLQVNNKFILPLNDGLVLLNHLLGLVRLASVLFIHILAHVVEGRELLVKSSDLVVFHNHKLI